MQVLELLRVPDPGTELDEGLARLLLSPSPTRDSDDCAANPRTGPARRMSVRRAGITRRVPLIEEEAMEQGESKCTVRSVLTVLHALLIVVLPAAVFVAVHFIRLAQKCGQFLHQVLK